MDIIEGLLLALGVGWFVCALLMGSGRLLNWMAGGSTGSTKKKPKRRW